MATVYNIKLEVVSDNTAYPNHHILNMVKHSISSIKGIRCTGIKIKS